MMFNFYRSLVVIIVLALMHLYFYNSNYIQKIDYKFYDVMTVLSSKLPKESSSTYSVIIDIDEKSIQDLGQWPWPRILNSELIHSINNMYPSGIGVSILFPERDRLSPVAMQQFYEQHFAANIDLTVLPPELRDNDQLFGQTLRSVGATLPVYLKNKFHTSEHCQEMSYKNNRFASIETTLGSEALLCNHPSLQDGIKDFGFINAWSDNDGLFRRVPLFMKYNDEVFPSLALSTLLSFNEGLELARNEDTILVNFAIDRPKVFSASDILRELVSAEDIMGKTVILGSSAVGLSSTYRISTGEEISDNMIHGIVIENILNNSFLVQPEYYKQINVFISFLLACFVFYFVSRKRYGYIGILLLVLGIGSLIYLFTNYLHGTYISIGYLWISFLSFLILLTIYHLWVINKEQQEQEKFLIRQSKLASMGEMIALIAHQWRQPLSAINGTVLNMDIDNRKKKLDAEKFEKYLNDIESTTAYLSKTINDFTDFFSKNKQAHIFNLIKVINQAQYLSAFSKSKNISVIYRECEDLEVNGYPSELIQSLLVLFNNAIYICNEKMESIGEGKVYIDVKKVGKNAIISVEDNGGGVSKKDMKKIFDPYFTTKDKQNGTGLGLYILRLIVEDSMNGKVSLENGIEGAIFSIEIPINMR